MRFRSYDSLRTFSIVAQHGSFSSAADTLNLTKGAISHQMRQLESELGFVLFHRKSRGIMLTDYGRDLLAHVETLFDGVEAKIASLQRRDARTLTIGVSTYLASRWLSPRLMDFMRMHPEIRLRVQPMIDLIDLRGEGVDVAIRWGRGDWKDVVTEPLFPCPAWPTGNADAAAKVRKLGLKKALSDMTLLRDRDDSNAWSHWYEAAGFSYTSRADTLIIPDPNVRVQAVIDGQGVALNDELVEVEINSGQLFRLGKLMLADYGYHLAYPSDATSSEEVELFTGWLKELVSGEQVAFGR